MSETEDTKTGVDQEEQNREWEFCTVLSRIKGEAIRVLERDPVEGIYRERVYNARDGLEDIVGEVYE